MTKNFTPSLLAFKGQVIQAQYQDPLLSIYRNNPLIEALPTILSEEEAMVRLAYYPEYDTGERTLPNHLRLHLLQNVQQFVEPLPIHLDLEQRFSRMIRSGYRSRNPLTPEFRQQFHQPFQLSDSGEFSNLNIRSTATGFTIMGISGIGKTTAIRSILSLYPQVIIHNQYQGQNFTLMQVVWLNLECPHDGSIKGLCFNFFQAIDELLGTNYSKNFSKARCTIDQLIPIMARIASLHCIGVLVIDEIQHLSEAKSGGSRKMLNFFVQLVNTIGIPVVLVGTYKAMSILSGEFRQTRRGSGQGDLIWDRMEEDDIWQLFVESLWRYQYLKQFTPLNETLTHSLYDVSQGITDFAVKVYLLAQVRAITTEKEKITEGIIRSVAKDSLRLARPILEALKNKNIQILQTVEDVHPIDITDYLQQAQEKVAIAGKIKSSPIIRQQNPASMQQNSEDENVYRTVSVSEKSPQQIKHPKSPVEVQGLIKLIESNNDQNLTNYELLKQGGYIRSVTEYLMEVNSL
ncbi:Tn7-like transposition protein C [Geminocystis sp. NIES-3708]|uniref:ATP-binding protein n=1 Tax=Geminocystis sp. NIES-3708 TaxID=1615909 RepID=UPI0005FCD0AD|nr:ATP-binding protein [Geminocystis sp. NIES-3708]BAQ60813.1 Tn7-like transposition protein C [Geminocystis sp. NIES-3708]